MWKLVKFKREKSYYYAQLPKDVNGSIIYVISREYVDRYLCLEKYCTWLEVQYGDVVLELYNIDYGPIIEEIKKNIYTGRIVDKNKWKYIATSLKLDTRPEIEAYIITPDSLDEFLKDLVRRYLCYLTYQLIKKARSLQQLFMGLSRMRESLEKSGIRLKRS